MKLQKTFFLLILCWLFSCKQEEKRESAVVQSIRQTGKLVTVAYTLTKMIRASDNKTWYKLGDRRILISVEASVKAGVDFQQLTQEDVAVNDKAITVQLPAPQVFSVSIPPDQIKVLYQDISTFRSRFTAAEREDLLRQAESQIRALADSMGILQTAEKNADIFMRNFLTQAGFQTVQVDFGK